MVSQAGKRGETVHLGPAGGFGTWKLEGPPERTALAFSVGVFIAFSPFLGLHTIMATALAFAFRFNKVAIYTGTFVNNPFLTLVPIIVASYAVGAFRRGVTFSRKIPKASGSTAIDTPCRARPTMMKVRSLARALVREPAQAIASMIISTRLRP